MKTIIKKLEKVSADKMLKFAKGQKQDRQQLLFLTNKECGELYGLLKRLGVKEKDIEGKYPISEEMPQKELYSACDKREGYRDCLEFIRQ